MFLRSDALVLSPTDLSSFLGCRHRIGLDLAVAVGVLGRPEWTDPLGHALRERGRAHEQHYVMWLRGQGLHVLDLTDHPDPEAGTREAMRQGVAVIYQAVLTGDGWRGYADILRRVERPSRLGGWSYEVYDTKLARETRGGTMLQLVAYSELLAGLQGVWPEQFHVVTPALASDVVPASGHPPAAALAPEVEVASGVARTSSFAGAALSGFGPSAASRSSTSAVAGGRTADAPFLCHAYRVADYAAFCRRVKAQLQCTLAGGHAAIQEAHYPERVEYCEVCHWWTRCNARRRADDHLSFIAGIARTQRTELVAQGVATLAAAAGMPVPLGFKPMRGSVDTYARLRDQARVQHQQRTARAPVHELLPVLPPLGLTRLPEPSSGDVFLDLEGARFAREGGREYLFGLWTAGAYQSWWAHTDAEEQAAFEAVMDQIGAAWAAHPGMHVYHFGHYEASTFKRLMGRHATRADELDRLLRGERFIDLYAVVRQALRAGVESYSIKQLEQFYAFEREVLLHDASAHLHAIELALEGHAADAIPDEVRQAVRGYNRDDCRSTEALRNWLEALRAALVALGTPVPRPETKDPAPPKQVSELEEQQDAVRAALLDGLPEAACEGTHPQHPRWLLAHLVGWHRREDKAQYWERYRLNDLGDDDLLDERQAIAGLEFVTRVDEVRRKDSNTVTGSVIDRYRYPAQDVEIGRKGKLLVTGSTPTPWGEIEAHDRVARLIDVKKGKSRVDVHPSAVFQADVVRTDEMQKALLRLSGQVRDAAASGRLDDARSCGLDLLFRRPPRLVSGALEPWVYETATDQAVRLATSLDRTTLAVQGPPGSGKTYLGAQMIRALVAAGRRVGVVAVSHKVIRNLLDAVCAQAEAAGESVRLGHKGGADDEPVRAVSASSGAGARAPGPGGPAVGHEPGNPTGLGSPSDVAPFAPPSSGAAAGALGASSARPRVYAYDDNPSALLALQSGEVQVLGGTAWLWAREEFASSVDVLVVDEAGQMSLANALAVSPAAGSVVLLGDPQQLEQPQKGSHPDGVDISALEHVLGGEPTMPRGQGLFLAESWRLAPAVCAFTSEVFYEGKLQSRDGLQQQRLVTVGVSEGAGVAPVRSVSAGAGASASSGAKSDAGAGTRGVADERGSARASGVDSAGETSGPASFDGAGLWWLPVVHEGNQHWSPEEIDVASALVDRLLTPGSQWVDAAGVSRQLEPRDVLVVAPYNAHVNRLADRLGGRGVRVGTVDKFQGQEAPVVIYAMGTSSPEDAPRGMEFLYSLNRLNVATSRARCAVFAVASPMLLQPECRTPRQMRLANALCRYVEIARTCLAL